MIDMSIPGFEPCLAERIFGTLFIRVELADEFHRCSVGVVVVTLVIVVVEMFAVVVGKTFPGLFFFFLVFFLTEITTTKNTSKINKLFIN
jgi:hypothetical protein